MKFAEYPVDTIFAPTDILLKDGATGTKKVVGSDLPYAIFDGVPMMHNNIYRGVNLGSSYTEAQRNAVSSGTFTGLWIGDYWTIGGIQWIIVDFDYWGGTTHHLLVMPRTGHYKGPVHPDVVAATGIRKTALMSNAVYPGTDSFQSLFNNLGFSHTIISRQGWNTQQGLPSSAVDIQTVADVLSQGMVIGSNPVNSEPSAPNGGLLRTNDSRQLSYFRMGGKMPLTSGQVSWLSDQTAAYHFSTIDDCMLITDARRDTSTNVAVLVYSLRG